MECTYDICAMIPGQNFPGDSGSSFVQPDPGTDYPFTCYVPRHIYGPGHPDYEDRGDEFWNEFDPAEIKRQRTRCVTVDAIDVGEYTGPAFHTWSASQESDIPDPLHDFSTDTPVAGTPFSDLRADACEEDDGVFLPSHDPYAWGAAVFSGLPTYVQGIRRSDFYIVLAKPFFDGAVPESFRVSAYDANGGGGTGHPVEWLRSCEWQMIGGTQLSLYEDDGDDRLFWYPRAIGGDGIGLAGLQIMSCMCPLATEGEQ